MALVSSPSCCRCCSRPSSSSSSESSTDRLSVRLMGAPCLAPATTMLPNMPLPRNQPTQADAAESPPPLTAPKRHQSWARVTLSPSLLRASVSISWVPLPPSLPPCLRPKKERVRGPILFRDGGCGLPSSSFPPRSPFGTTIAVEPSLPSFDERKRGCGRRRRGFANSQKSEIHVTKARPSV